MIPELVKAWEENKDVLQQKYEKEHPSEYKHIVKDVVGALVEAYDWGNMDPEKIHEIDDGHYQGTLLYIIPEEGYQPGDYWYVKVGYGSCSGCDTLESILSDAERDDDYNPLKPTEQQTKDYMTLALHIVQGLKKMGDDEA